MWFYSYSIILTHVESKLHEGRCSVGVSHKLFPGSNTVPSMWQGLSKFQEWMNGFALQGLLSKLKTKK